MGNNVNTLSVPRKFRGMDVFQWLIIFGLLSGFAISVMDPDFALALLFQQWKWYLLIAFFGIIVVINIGRPVRFGGYVPACLLIFIFVAAFSSVLSEHSLTEAFSRSFSFIMLWSIAFMYPSPVNPEHRLRFWTSACLALLVLIVLLNVPSLFSYEGRLKGITANPNTLGTMTALVFVGSFALAFSGYRKLGSGILTCVAVVMLVCTGSRAATFAALAGVAAVFARFSSRNIWRFGTLLLIVGIALYLVRSEYLGGEQTIFTRDLQFNTRVDSWQHQIDSFKEAPILGNGLQIDWSDTHNRSRGGEGSYTDILAASGLMGGIPFLIGVVVGVVNLYKRQRINMADRRSALAWESCAFGMTITILINSIGEGYMAAVGSVMSIYAWVMLGLPPTDVRSSNK